MLSLSPVELPATVEVLGLTWFASHHGLPSSRVLSPMSLSQDKLFAVFLCSSCHWPPALVFCSNDPQSSSISLRASHILVLTPLIALVIDLRRDCIYNFENTDLEIGVSGVYLHLL